MSIDPASTSPSAAWRRWPLWLAAVGLPLYWLAIFIATHLPPDRAWQPSLVSDKLIHACAFAGLAALMVTLLVHVRRDTAWRHALFTILVLAMYAAVDEWTQDAFGRQPDLLDWTADFLGAVLGSILTLLFWRSRPARDVSEA